MASVWTVVLLLLGAVGGYIVGSKQLDISVQKFKERFKKKPENSGPIKPPTPKELEYKKNKTVVDRQRELMK